MTIRRPTTLLAGAAALVLTALAIVGCGGSDDTATPTTSAVARRRSASPTRATSGRSSSTLAWPRRIRHSSRARRLGAGLPRRPGSPIARRAFASTGRTAAISPATAERASSEHPRLFGRLHMRRRGRCCPGGHLLRRNSVKQHPNMHLIDVRCSSCGASFSIRSTAEAISVDVCSNCHPAYTGRERTVRQRRPNRAFHSAARARRCVSSGGSPSSTYGAQPVSIQVRKLCTCSAGQRPSHGMLPSARRR